MTWISSNPLARWVFGCPVEVSTWRATRCASLNRMRRCFSRHSIAASAWRMNPTPPSVRVACARPANGSSPSANRWPPGTALISATAAAGPSRVQRDPNFPNCGLCIRARKARTVGHTGRAKGGEVTMEQALNAPRIVAPFAPLQLRAAKRRCGRGDAPRQRRRRPLHRLAGPGPRRPTMSRPVMHRHNRDLTTFR
jgi:hypothetical protein